MAFDNDNLWSSRLRLRQWQWSAVNEKQRSVLSTSDSRIPFTTPVRPTEGDPAQECRQHLWSKPLYTRWKMPWCYLKKINKQVRQQACRTQIPPYGLKQRGRPQFRLPLAYRWAVPVRNGSSPEWCRRPVTPREPQFTKTGEDLSG